MLTTNISRFSLYCLEDGEQYVTDVLGSLRGPEWDYKGTLRLCTRSVFIEPNDISEPIVRLPFKGIKGIGREGESIVLSCTTSTMMLRDGLVGMHEKKELDGTYTVSLQWEGIDQFATLLENLVGAHSQMEDLPRALPVFDYSGISLAEDICLELEIFKQLPLRRTKGRLVLTSKCLYIQLSECVDGNPLMKIALADVSSCARRKVLSESVAVEIYDAGGHPHLVIFGSEAECNEFWRAACRHEDIPILKHGHLSTYDYLMNLNWAAGRSLNDLSQYPVMPWVIKDYTSKVLDLENPGIYRDLSKPIGALNKDRLESFITRMQQSEEGYLYGTHYSCPSYVMYYLVREHPEWMLLVHNGKFDKGSRLFTDVGKCWANVATLTNDVKELIPQFYNGTARFLEGGGVDYGVLDDGTRVPNNVALPPWACSPQEFIRISRAALEGPHVSANIHKWIDLIFGYEARGEHANAAHNLFHPLTYETAEYDRSDVSKQTQITEFGQCPAQIFTMPHPPRVVRNTKEWEITDTLQPVMDVEGKVEVDALEALVSPERLMMMDTDEREQQHVFQTVQFIPAMKRGATSMCGFRLGEVPDWLERLMHAAYSETGGSEDGFDSSFLDAVLVSGKQGQLPILDLIHGTRLRTLQMGVHTLTGVTTFENQIFSSSEDGYVYVYDVASGRLHDRVKAADGAPLTNISVSKTRLLLTAADDGSVGVWDVRGTGDLTRNITFSEHTCSVKTVSWCTEQDWNAVSCGEDAVVMYDIRDPSSVVSIPVDGGQEAVFVSNTDGKEICVARNDGVQVCDTRMVGEVLWETPAAPVTSSLFSSDSSLWYSSSTSLTALNPKTGALRGATQTSSNPIHAAAPLPPVPSSSVAKFLLSTYDETHTKVQVLTNSSGLW